MSAYTAEGQTFHRTMQQAMEGNCYLYRIDRRNFRGGGVGEGGTRTPTFWSGVTVPPLFRRIAEK